MMTLMRRAVFVTLLFFLVVPVNAAPITFNTALPVSEGQLIYRGLLSISRSSDDSSSAVDQELDTITVSSVLGYGINNKLAVFGVLPYSDRELEESGVAGSVTRGNQGFGDISGFARYQLWQQDGLGSTLRLAGVGGLTAPTGNDDRSDGVGRLPASLQTGSGAWDWFAAIVATHQTLTNEFNGQISYRDNRESGGIELGDTLSVDVSWQHRLWRQDVVRGVPAFFYSVLELNVLHQDKNRLNGRSNRNTGGDRVWLSPGVQYVARRWILEAVIQIPVIQSLNGNALENDFVFTTGFRRSF